MCSCDKNVCPTAQLLKSVIGSTADRKIRQTHKKYQPWNSQEIPTMKMTDGKMLEHENLHTFAKDFLACYYCIFWELQLHCLFAVWVMCITLSCIDHIIAIWSVCWVEWNTFGLANFWTGSFCLLALCHWGGGGVPLLPILVTRVDIQYQPIIWYAILSEWKSRTTSVKQEARRSRSCLSCQSTPVPTFTFQFKNLNISYLNN